jgi:threonine dehydrogenase-like Zn-dependent dehydrogenase
MPAHPCRSDAVVVGVAHGVELPAMDLFWSLAHLHGGPAPVRRFLPDLIDLIWNRQIDPGKVFDLELPLDEAAADTRRWTTGARSRRSCARNRTHHKGKDAGNGQRLSAT